MSTKQHRAKTALRALAIATVMAALPATFGPPTEDDVIVHVQISTATCQSGQCEFSPGNLCEVGGQWEYHMLEKW